MRRHPMGLDISRQYSYETVVRNAIHQSCVKVGVVIRRVNIEKLFATYILAPSTYIDTVEDLLRHNDTSTTQIYTH